jgi:hypothetical protein
MGYPICVIKNGLRWCDAPADYGLHKIHEPTSLWLVVVSLFKLYIGLSLRERK